MGNVIGIDIGQRRNPTAICVAQIEHRPHGKATEEHFLIRHLERLPLGTAYQEVAIRIAEIETNLRDLTDDPLRLFVDATGVGQPIVDLLRERIVCSSWWRSTSPTEIGGPRKAGRASRLARHISSHGLALLQTGRLHLARTIEARAMAEELLAYEIRVDANANDRYGAFKVGTHDDLVTALGLTVQDRQRSFSYARARPRQTAG